MDLLENREYLAALRGIENGTDLDFLRGRSILVTGASGLLGSCLVDALMLWNLGRGAPCRVIAAGRNAERTGRRFARFLGRREFSARGWDICDSPEGLSEPVDYIVHAASNADPVSMAEDPVGTLAANVAGTKNLLDYGLSHGMRRFLFVSSGEIYGQPEDGMSAFCEDYCGPLDLSSPRSCYPEGKRAAEVLCQGYISRRGADAVIVRPCHLFGPTVTGGDSRAVSEFVRQAAEGRDIVLKSSGLRERSHCYAPDAVAAMLLVLGRGACGEAYNIADRAYQMTIREFAEQAAAAGGCRVVFARPGAVEADGYSAVTRAVLDASRLERLGWRPGRRGVSAIAETVEILRWRRGATGCKAQGGGI